MSTVTEIVSRQKLNSGCVVVVVVLIQIQALATVYPVFCSWMVKNYPDMRQQWEDYSSCSFFLFKTWAKLNNNTRMWRRREIYTESDNGE